MAPGHRRRKARGKSAAISHRQAKQRKAGCHSTAAKAVAAPKLNKVSKKRSKSWKPARSRPRYWSKVWQCAEFVCTLPHRTLNGACWGVWYAAAALASALLLVVSPFIGLAERLADTILTVVLEPSEVRMCSALNAAG